MVAARALLTTLLATTAVVVVVTVVVEVMMVTSEINIERSLLGQRSPFYELDASVAGPNGWDVRSHISAQ
jgi:hypothetical protein